VSFPPPPSLFPQQRFTRSLSGTPPSLLFLMALSSELTGTSGGTCFVLSLHFNYSIFCSLFQHFSGSVDTTHCFTLPAFPCPCYPCFLDPNFLFLHGPMNAVLTPGAREAFGTPSSLTMLLFDFFIPPFTLSSSYQ